MADRASLHAVIHGHVQGVFFRAFVLEKAVEIGLNGWVRNVVNGSVELQAEGERVKLEELLSVINIGPPASRVTGVDVEWSDYKGEYQEFDVRYR